ncbi:MAG: hypothetical protein NTU94_04765 [Planctomycetota bacterium]|nr:hypothetical protein [Planctomycetota bacterium]
MCVQAGYYRLQLESDLASHAMPADAEEFDEQEFGVFRQCKAEGVRL